MLKTNAILHLIKKQGSSSRYQRREAGLKCSDLRSCNEAEDDRSEALIMMLMTIIMSYLMLIMLMMIIIYEDDDEDVEEENEGDSQDTFYPCQEVVKTTLHLAELT